MKLKRMNFRVVSNEVASIPNFIEIRYPVLKLKHVGRWTNTVSPTGVLLALEIKKGKHHVIVSGVLVTHKHEHI
jgi:hypothetical protein